MPVISIRIPEEQFKKLNDNVVNWTGLLNKPVTYTDLIKIGIDIVSKPIKTKDIEEHMSYCSGIIFK